MSQTSAGRAADTAFLPTLTPAITQAGVDTSVYTLSTSGTATKLVLTLPTNKGKVYIRLGVTGTTTHVALKLGDAAASVTTTTGFPIAVGTIVEGWINPNEVNNIEAVTASAAAVLYVHVCSPKYEGA